MFLRTLYVNFPGACNVAVMHIMYIIECIIGSVQCLQTLSHIKGEWDLFNKVENVLKTRLAIFQTNWRFKRYFSHILTIYSCRITNITSLVAIFQKMPKPANVSKQ